MNSSRNTFSLFFISGGLLLCVGVGFLVGRYVAPAGHSQETNEPVPSEGSSQGRTAVVARGRLEPNGGVIHVGIAMGDRLNHLFVEEGQEVTKGAELARLESYSDRNADYELAESQVEEAKKRLKAIEDAGQASILEAKIYKSQVEKVEPLDLQAQKAKVRLLEDQLTTARTDLGRLKALKLGSITQQQMELQTLAVRKAEEELEAASALRDKIEAAHQINLKAADAKLQAAEATLARYKAEIPLQSLENTQKQAKVRLDHTTIRAPCAGKILKIIAHEGEALGTQAILQMGDTQHMTVIAEVYETDVQYVHKGDRATISSPAFSTPLEGNVVRVGSMVAKNHLFNLNPTAASDQRVVLVKISLDDSKTAASFINLQVTATIKLSGKK